MMILDKYKRFWGEYCRYKLHPQDEAECKHLLSKSGYSVRLEFSELSQKLEGELKDNPHAIHTNMYCKSFVGDLEHAKVILLFGNPGLNGASDYFDEHQNKPFMAALNKNLAFEGEGFFPLGEVAEDTTTGEYWVARCRKLIRTVAEDAGISEGEARKMLEKNICVLQSIGYHSQNSPRVKPERLPSSQMTKRLVHEYFLPKARRGEVLILAWRQVKFWGVSPGRNVLVRNPNAAINSYFSPKEIGEIVNFLG